jgi:hypothetical protein
MVSTGTLAWIAFVKHIKETRPEAFVGLRKQSDIEEVVNRIRAENPAAYKTFMEEWNEKYQASSSAATDAEETAAEKQTMPEGGIRRVMNILQESRASIRAQIQESEKSLATLQADYDKNKAMSPGNMLFNLHPIIKENILKREELRKELIRLRDELLQLERGSKPPELPIEPKYLTAQTISQKGLSKANWKNPQRRTNWENAKRIVEEQSIKKMLYLKEWNSALAIYIPAYKRAVESGLREEDGSAADSAISEIMSVDASPNGEGRGGGGPPSFVISEGGGKKRKSRHTKRKKSRKHRRTSHR